MRRLAIGSAGIVGLIVLTLFGSLGSAIGQPASPVVGEAEADIASAVTWLTAQQNEDGSFSGFSGEPDPGTTVDAVLALVAAGVAGHDTAGAVANAMSYLEGDGVIDAYANTGPGQAAKLVLAQVATGGDPAFIGGVDPLALVEASQDDATGLYGTSVFDHALALMALAASGREIPEIAIDAFQETQGPEGGWAFDGVTDEGAADSNTTAVVVQALVAADQADHEMVAGAVAYLETTIEGSSGAVYQPGAGLPADSSSTALVLQALIAIGGDVDGSLLDTLRQALAAFQNDSGAFHYNVDDQSDNPFSTVQAIPAAAGVAFPIVPAGDTAVGAHPVAVLDTVMEEAA